MSGSLGNVGVKRICGGRKPGAVVLGGVRPQRAGCRARVRYESPTKSGGVLLTFPLMGESSVTGNAVPSHGKPRKGTADRPSHEGGAVGAGGGIRTHTGLRPARSEGAGSASCATVSTRTRGWQPLACHDAGIARGPEPRRQFVGEGANGHSRNHAERARFYAAIEVKWWSSGGDCNGEGRDCNALAVHITKRGGGRLRIRANRSSEPDQRERAEAPG